MMHDAALRGGAPDPEAHPGCFLAGAGVIAWLALRLTPGAYPALSMLLIGLLVQGATWKRPGVRNGWRTALPFCVWLPLLVGTPAALLARPAWLIPFWLAVYAAVGAAVWRLAVRSLFRWELLASGTASEASVVACAPAGVRDDSVLQLAPLLLTEGSAGRLRTLLEGVGEDLHTARGRQVMRLRSVLAFLERDLDRARDLTNRLMAARVDLEEVRQFRAWAAYLCLAAGCPREAAVLAEQALGPHALAGEAWFEHCYTLRTWALAELGLHQEADATARFVLLNSRHDSPYRADLERLPHCTSVPDATQGAPANRPDEAKPDVESSAAAQAAGSPFERACVWAELGYAWLALGEPRRAAVEFRRAQGEWEWLPTAAEGLSLALQTVGEFDAARRTREAAAERFPQHRVARGAGVAAG